MASFRGRSASSAFLTETNIGEQNNSNSNNSPSGLGVGNSAGATTKALTRMREAVRRMILTSGAMHRWDANMNVDTVQLPRVVALANATVTTGFAAAPKVVSAAPTQILEAQRDQAFGSSIFDIRQDHTEHETAAAAASSTKIDEDNPVPSFLEFFGDINESNKQQHKGASIGSMRNLPQLAVDPPTLPSEMPLRRMVELVMDHQSVQTRHAMSELVRLYLVSERPTRIYTLSFWIALLLVRRQPSRDLELQLHHALALEYGKMFSELVWAERHDSIHDDKRDTVLRLLPSITGQVVFYAMTHCFPQNRTKFSMTFRKRLLRMLTFWFSGVDLQVTAECNDWLEHVEGRKRGVSQVRAKELLQRSSSGSSLVAGELSASFNTNTGAGGENLSSSRRLSSSPRRRSSSIAGLQQQQQQPDLADIRDRSHAPSLFQMARRVPDQFQQQSNNSNSNSGRRHGSIASSVGSHDSTSGPVSSGSGLPSPQHRQHQQGSVSFSPPGRPQQRLRGLGEGGLLRSEDPKASLGEMPEEMSLNRDMFPSRFQEMLEEQVREQQLKLEQQRAAASSVYADEFAPRANRAYSRWYEARYARGRLSIDRVTEFSRPPPLPIAFPLLDAVMEQESKSQQQQQGGDEKKHNHNHGPGHHHGQHHHKCRCMQEEEGRQRRAEEQAKKEREEEIARRGGTGAVAQREALNAQATALLSSVVGGGGGGGGEPSDHHHHHHQHGGGPSSAMSLTQSGSDSHLQQSSHLDGSASNVQPPSLKPKELADILTPTKPATTASASSASITFESVNNNNNNCDRSSACPRRGTASAAPGSPSAAGSPKSATMTTASSSSKMKKISSSNLKKDEADEANKTLNVQAVRELRTHAVGYLPKHSPLMLYYFKVCLEQHPQSGNGNGNNDDGESSFAPSYRLDASGTRREIQMSRLSMLDRRSHGAKFSMEAHGIVAHAEQLMAGQARESREIAALEDRRREQVRECREKWQRRLSIARRILRDVDSPSRNPELRITISETTKELLLALDEKGKPMDEVVAGHLAALRSLEDVVFRLPSAKARRELWALGSRVYMRLLHWARAGPDTVDVVTQDDVVVEHQLDDMLAAVEERARLDEAEAARRKEEDEAMYQRSHLQQQQQQNQSLSEQQREMANKTKVIQRRKQFDEERAAFFERLDLFHREALGDKQMITREKVVHLGRAEDDPTDESFSETVDYLKRQLKEQRIAHTVSPARRKTLMADFKVSSETDALRRELGDEAVLIMMREKQQQEHSSSSSQHGFGLTPALRVEYEREQREANKQRERAAFRLYVAEQAEHTTVVTPSPPRKANNTQQYPHRRPPLRFKLNDAAGHDDDVIAEKTQRREERRLKEETVGPGIGNNNNNTQVSPFVEHVWSSDEDGDSPLSSVASDAEEEDEKTAATIPSSLAQRQRREQQHVNETAKQRADRVAARQQRRQRRAAEKMMADVIFSAIRTDAEKLNGQAEEQEQEQQQHVSSASLGTSTFFSSQRGGGPSPWASGKLPLSPDELGAVTAAATKSSNNNNKSAPSPPAPRRFDNLPLLFEPSSPPRVTVVTLPSESDGDGGGSSPVSSPIKRRRDVASSLRAPPPASIATPSDQDALRSELQIFNNNSSSSSNNIHTVVSPTSPQNEKAPRASFSGLAGIFADQAKQQQRGGGSNSSGSVLAASGSAHFGQSMHHALSSASNNNNNNDDQKHGADNEIAARRTMNPVTVSMGLRGPTARGMPHRRQQVRLDLQEVLDKK